MYKIVIFIINLKSILFFRLVQVTDAIAQIIIQEINVKYVNKIVIIYALNY